MFKFSPNSMLLVRLARVKAASTIFSPKAPVLRRTHEDSIRRFQKSKISYDAGGYDTSSRPVRNLGMTSFIFGFAASGFLSEKLNGDDRRTVVGIAAWLLSAGLASGVRLLRPGAVAPGTAIPLAMIAAFWAVGGAEFFKQLTTGQPGQWLHSILELIDFSRQKVSLDDLKLQSIQVLFRHGDRTPLRPIPFLPGVQWPKELMANTPASPVQYVLTGLDGKVMTRSPHDDKLWNIVFPGGAKAGHLTTVGKQQMFDLGRRLRMEYFEKRRLLNPAYSESQVYVRSTNILRTVESAQWMVSGMFDAAAKGAKPVVIHTDLEEDSLYPKWRLIEYDGLFISPDYHETWNMIDSHAIEMLKLMVSGPDEKKRITVLSLSCGAVLHMVAANMDTAGQVTDSKKMFVYSAHDSLMMALLLTLGFFDGHWPPFAADIVFELYTDKQDKKWVRILFMGRPQKLGKEQEEIISYDKFKKLIAPFSLSYKKYRRVCDVQEVEGGEVMDVIGGRKK